MALVANPLTKETLDLDNVGPEVKSYIYQILSEFEPYTSPETKVAVIAKDPMVLFDPDRTSADWDSADMLKRMYRISITLKEDGSKLEAEGLDADIFVALKKAKDNLLKTLVDIHDNVTDNKERSLAIHSALTGSQLIH